MTKSLRELASYPGIMTFTRPTTPLTRGTFIPCGWVAELVSISCCD